VCVCLFELIDSNSDTEGRYFFSHCEKYKRGYRSGDKCHLSFDLK
jgi:hypothetical protein